MLAIELGVGWVEQRDTQHSNDGYHCVQPILPRCENQATYEMNLEILVGTHYYFVIG